MNPDAYLLLFQNEMRSECSHQEPIKQKPKRTTAPKAYPSQLEALLETQVGGPKANI